MEPSIDAYIDAAEQHGLNSEPDHEVGDLQDCLRAMWEILGPEQQKVFRTLTPARNVLAESKGDWKVSVPDEATLLRALRGVDGHPEYPRSVWVKTVFGQSDLSYWAWVIDNLKQAT